MQRYVHSRDMMAIGTNSEKYQQAPRTTTTRSLADEAASRTSEETKSFRRPRHAIETRIEGSRSDLGLSPANRDDRLESLDRVGAYYSASQVGKGRNRKEADCFDLPM